MFSRTNTSTTSPELSGYAPNSNNKRTIMSTNLKTTLETKKKVFSSSPLVSSVVTASSPLVSSVVSASSPLVSSVVTASSPLVSSVVSASSPLASSVFAANSPLVSSVVFTCHSQD